MIDVVFDASIAEVLDDHMADQRLKDALFGQGVIGAWAGPKDKGTASIKLMHYQGDLEGRGPLWGYVRGGMGMISFAIADAAQEAGAVLATGVPVAEIVPDEGVRLEDGTLIRAATVVCNADPKVALRLLGDHDLPARLQGPPRGVADPQPGREVQLRAHRLPTWTAAPGEDFPARGTVDVTTGLDAAQLAFESCARGEPAVGFGEIYVQTVHDPTPAPRGKHLLSVFGQYAPYDFDWDNRRDEVGRQFIDLISRFAPDFEDCLEHHEVLGPPDIEARIGLTGGNIFQGETMPDQMWEHRLPARTPLPGLYLCGAATHPAGSVIALNGRNAAMAVLEDARAGTGLAEALAFGAVRRILLVALLLLAAAPAPGGQPSPSGRARTAALAVDDAGAVYLGWQVNTEEPGDARPVLRRPGPQDALRLQVTIPFPGRATTLARAVLLPARAWSTSSSRAQRRQRPRLTYLARSPDGGRTFGPAVAIAGDGFDEGVLGPGGRVALVDGPTTARAGLFSPDGSSAGPRAARSARSSKACSPPSPRPARSCSRPGATRARLHAFRLGAGGDPNNVAAWQQLDPAPGREPALAGLPGGFAVMLEPSDAGSPVRTAPRGHGVVSAGRLIPAVNNNGFELAGSTRGRLTAVINYSALPPRLHDLHRRRRPVVLRRQHRELRRVPVSLQVATNATGAGAAAFADAFGAKAIHITRFTPRTAPVVRKRFRRVNARVQVRSTCSGDKELSLVVDAARGNRRIAPSTVLRRASFRSTRRARRGFRSSSARATSCAAAPRGSPCGSPRAAARPARCACACGDAARRADVRAQPAEHPHAGPGRC